MKIRIKGINWKAQKEIRAYRRGKKDGYTEGHRDGYRKCVKLNKLAEEYEKSKNRKKIEKFWDKITTPLDHIPVHEKENRSFQYSHGYFQRMLDEHAKKYPPGFTVVHLGGRRHGKTFYQSKFKDSGDFDGCRKEFEARVLGKPDPGIPATGPIEPGEEPVCDCYSIGPVGGGWHARDCPAYQAPYTVKVSIDSEGNVNAVPGEKYPTKEPAFEGWGGNFFVMDVPMSKADLHKRLRAAFQYGHDTGKSAGINIGTEDREAEREFEVRFLK